MTSHTPWPVARPTDWAARVNEPIAEAELDRLRLHLLRDRPYGEAEWMQAAARRGLEWTFRERGRPSEKKAKGQSTK